ncbi:MAG: gliding motility-associated C-terminal domain-containing protein [Prevotellaceae bacterium]|jgi:gliding motility-associated-like protein|nr:gliding motility-associated C-terminal domain-containing protein [Prevotellaceae bacterium]
MKTHIAILLFLLPYAAQAQLSVPGMSNSAGTVVSSTLLTGREEPVFVFYDSIPLTLSLQATDSLCVAPATCSAPSTFTWQRLNVEKAGLNIIYKEYPASGISVLSAASLTEGGYQVTIQRADASLVDTLTTWIIVDTFRVDTVMYTNQCDGLRLQMSTTPPLYYNGDINAYPYIIYNFKDFLTPPHNTGESHFSGVQEVYWTSNKDIHNGVDKSDNTWQHGLSNNVYATIINNPPPLYAASYTVEVTDMFGKSSSYTTPYAVEAIAVYPQAKVEKEDDELPGTWKDAGTASKDEPLELEGEALFRLTFSHAESINADKYVWEGFANAAMRNSNKTVVWHTDTLTNLEGETRPRMPHKGHEVDGYVPGTYTVRLVASNAHCTNAATVTIAVKPSSLTTESIPNAFTPNGDNMNDRFEFVRGKEPVSMEYIRVYIYNRSGGLVYRYDGPADAWTGWDGRFMGTGNDVAEGVYFYIISGEGWDGVNYNTSEYKGSVHLFR